MDYGGRRMYTVADSRQPMYCTYSTRPDSFMGQPMSSINLTPQTRLVQCTSGDPFIANQRLMVLPPRIRRVFSGIDDDDEDEDPTDAYVSPPLNRPASQRVEHYIDDMVNSPQMNEIEMETRKIRRDAQAVLQRLGESTKRKPVRLSSVYCPDLSYSSTSSSTNYATRPYSSYLSSSYPTYGERDRDIGSGVPDIDMTSDEFYVRPKKHIVPAYINPSVYNYRPLAHDPVAQVQSEINRKAMYSENCRKITDSIRGTPKKKKLYPDADEVKNNINFRAQYKSLRDAAQVGIALSKKPNDYLMV